MIIMNKDNYELWYQRLDHMIKKGMKTITSKGKPLELNFVDLRIYEDYILDKQKNVSFIKNLRTFKFKSSN